MFSSLLLPGWREFFTRLERSLETAPFDRRPFAADMCAWEQAWSRRTDAPLPTEPRGDAVATAQRLIAEYRDLLRWGASTPGSTERLTLTGCRGRFDRVQHAVAR